MFTVILILWGSAAIGYVLRRHPFRAVGRLTTWSVWLLLFLMGCEVGANPDLISQLGTLGLEALILTVASFAGCMGAVMGFLGVPPKTSEKQKHGFLKFPVRSKFLSHFPEALHPATDGRKHGHRRVLCLWSFGHPLRLDSRPATGSGILRPLPAVGVRRIQHRAK